MATNGTDIILAEIGEIFSTKPYHPIEEPNGLGGDGINATGADNLARLLNAFVANANLLIAKLAALLQTTSGTSHDISLGNKLFITDTNNSWQIGASVSMWSRSMPVNRLKGVVSLWNGVNQLTINVTDSEGVGVNITDWAISAGEDGPAGRDGITGYISASYADDVTLSGFVGVYDLALTQSDKSIRLDSVMGTILAGDIVYITNVGAEIFTLKDNDGEVLKELLPLQKIVLILIDDSTAAGTWKELISPLTLAEDSAPKLAATLDGQNNPIINSVLIATPDMWTYDLQRANDGDYVWSLNHEFAEILIELYGTCSAGSFTCELKINGVVTTTIAPSAGSQSDATFSVPAIVSADDITITISNSSNVIGGYLKLKTTRNITVGA